MPADHSHRLQVERLQIHFQGDEVMLTYYRTLEETAGRELKIKILPLDWLYD